MGFKPMVKTIGGEGFHGNALVFATHNEAEEWAKDLWARWTLMADYRIDETDNAVNYRLINNELERVEEIQHGA